MRTLLIIGIGAGDPEQVTTQAAAALNQVDVFFVIDKGQATRELVDLRTEICDRYIAGSGYRIVEIPDVQRDRTGPEYRRAVSNWHEERAARCAEIIALELADGGTGGFLVWGDPAIYDSTIRIVENICQRSGLEFDYRVIPGISSVQQLAAAHRIVLNGIGEPILITTGRRLDQSVAGGAQNIVVMLDADLACRSLLGSGLGWQIYWGAYLGTSDETLFAGRLADVIDEISRIRVALRERKGWIMDTYLLRRVQN